MRPAAAVALLAASSVPWHGVRGGVGDRTYAPLSAAQVRPVYDGGVGDLRIDLSGVDVGHLRTPISTRGLSRVVSRGAAGSNCGGPHTIRASGYPYCTRRP